MGWPCGGEASAVGEGDGVFSPISVVLFVYRGGWE